jgi:cytochrome c peroxidase
MSLVNVAYSPVLTWANPNLDRLSEQALAPMFGDDPVELGMGGQEDLLAERLGADPQYQRLFAAAYPGERPLYTVDHITKALGSFQRTILSGDSPYDRYRRGDEPEAISASAKRGETLFFSERLECAHCHGGINFTATVDYFAKGFAEIEFHNNGLYNLEGEFSYPKRNLGLFPFTREPGDVGKFKPPTLRNIAVTAPYMHDGSLATLSDVLDHYAAGGTDNPNKSELIKPFQLTEQERADLIAFLESLTDQTVLTNPAFADPWPQD